MHIYISSYIYSPIGHKNLTLPIAILVALWYKWYVIRKNANCFYRSLIFGKELFRNMYEAITSRKNPRIAEARALADKKERDRTGRFFVEGSKLCEELLKESSAVETVFFTERAREKYAFVVEPLLQAAKERFCVTDEVYDKLTDEQHPEGIFAVAQKPTVFRSIDQTTGNGGFLILDGVQNPSNLGTVVRTASAFGVERILLGEGCADPFGPKALRASMGTIFKVKLCIVDCLYDSVRTLCGGAGKLYGAALSEKARDIRSLSFSAEDHIVIGSEGRGISEPILSLCDTHVIIPMCQNVESLNAAAATAIFLWEKQKGVMP